MKFTPIAERKQTRHFSDGLRLKEIYRDLADIFSIFFTFDIFVWHLQCRDKQLQSDYKVRAGGASENRQKRFTILYIIPII